MVTLVAPGLRAGRGLKLDSAYKLRMEGIRSSRPSGWERIETLILLNSNQVNNVAPGLRAGRGLKPPPRRPESSRPQVAPGLRAGRGLKPQPALVPVVCVM